MKVCAGVLTDETKALKLTISTFIIYLYSHLQVMALFHYHDTATVRNQHQLLTRKTSKITFILLLKTTIFESSTKINEMQYL